MYRVIAAIFFDIASKQLPHDPLADTRVLLQRPRLEK